MRRYFDDESRGCDFQRKTRYKNKAAARTAAAKITKKAGLPFSHYRCRACRFWHLTRVR